MLPRRLIRIKALHSIYACLLNPTLLLNPLKILAHSFDKSKELYFQLLCLVKEMKFIESKKKEIEKTKFIQSSAKLQEYNFRFLNNDILFMIDKNKEVNKFIQRNNSFWSDDGSFQLKMYNSFREKYPKYFLPTLSYNFSNQKLLLFTFFYKFLYNEESLYNYLETKSIFWNDEIDFWLQMIAKSIKKLTLKSKNITIYSTIKDDVDLRFSQDLLQHTINNFQEYRSLIQKHLSANWEYNRLAIIDKILISMAITEITRISGIPIHSSFNEYIEIAKLYSTPKSSKFVNGVLDSIIKRLKKENKIKLID